MASFPSSVCGYPLYPLEESYVDAVIRVQVESGYEQTRARFTRQRRTWSNVRYVMATTVKDTLSGFYSTTIGGGADAFDWNPTDATTYTVRFSGPIQFTLVVPGYWQAEFSLNEV